MWSFRGCQGSGEGRTDRRKDGQAAATASRERGAALGESVVKPLPSRFRSSKIFKQKLESVPDQTSSEEQMENWSKERHIPEQKKDDFCAEFQFHQNSQKNTEFFIEAEVEAPKLSYLPVTSQRGGAPSDYNSYPEEPSTMERKANRMLPEFIPSWKDAADLGGKTETAFLLKELDTLRAKNKKLQDKLSERDKELKTIKLDLELQERATEAKIAEKIAALVEEVYSAQRERDEAVMARLRLANEERDEAFLWVQRLEESLKELENINPEENDMTLQELLNRINNADTGIDILKNGAIILNRIHRTKERKKKIIAEEMNAVIEQRDAALSQCKRLEQELHHLKEQNQTSANNTRHLTAENNQERALKADLIALQQEKEAALQQCKKLEEEIQTLHVYYSLSKSLSEGMSLKDQLNCTSGTCEGGPQGREGVVTLTYRQIEDLAAQLQQARSEQKDTELKLQKALEASQEANEKVQKD
ncbi:mirror-image polydactyly gene 1 protein isoform X1 [Rissa tridactyla]|uniref:mirror-image polydactyly gene 1 protein isoform X1 n=1 Tax=Rissa tridactyla TaxID=75485 RepID=UPI0023BA827A|nr:mirror-image polydactyly gene 1 protein isoform X1 [Rissa tridactyla]